ncbi:MAG: MaoC/PaaZ C-terminal domain-containing protein [Chloroflexota bacterium]
MSQTTSGRYFEDFAVGEVLVTSRRTITEADIVSFAGLSGDFNPLHTDEVYGQSTPFGGRIAHGMLVVSVGTGLVNQTGWFVGTTLALLEITRKFVGVVKPGDTIHLTMEVVSARESSRGDRGIVTFSIRIVNQRDETVIEGQEVVMLRRRPTEKSVEQ